MTLLHRFSATYLYLVLCGTLFRHFFAATLLQHFSPTLFPNTAPQHSPPTLLHNVSPRSSVTLLYNTVLHHFYAPRFLTLPNTSIQHFPPTSLNNTSRPHSSPTLLYKSSPEFLKALSTTLLCHNSPWQYNGCGNIFRIIFFWGGELCFFKDFHWKWRGMRWGWASHPVDSVKKLQIEVIFKKHTKPGFCFWCFSRELFFWF